jgi:hypothetical protein
MTHDEARRLLECVYPEQRDRAPFAATLLRRLVDGEPIGRLLSEAVRHSAPPAPNSADATPVADKLPDTLPTGRPARPTET